MTLRICSSLLLLLSGCATSFPGRGSPEPIPVDADTYAAQQGKPVPRPKPVSKEALAETRRMECEPQSAPRINEDELHDKCASNVPQNNAAGYDVFIKNRRFDAVQTSMRVLWKVKADDFEAYPADTRDLVARKHLDEIHFAHNLAKACGFTLSVGVRSAAHRSALLKQEPSLNVVVMDWC